MKMNHRPYFLMAILCLAGCGDSSTQPPDAPETPAGTTANTEDLRDDPHQFGDFSFSILKGWSVVRPDRDKTKAMLLFGGTSWRNAKSMIKVDVGAPVAPTARQLAEGFANNAGGTVSADTLDFDGTPGVVASTSSTDLTTPRSMIIVYRNGHAYLLMAGAVQGVDINEAVSRVRESWKWTQTDE